MFVLVATMSRTPAGQWPQQTWTPLWRHCTSSPAPVRHPAAGSGSPRNLLARAPQGRSPAARSRHRPPGAVLEPWPAAGRPRSAARNGLPMQRQNRKGRAGPGRDVRRGRAGPQGPDAGAPEAARSRHRHPRRPARPRTAGRQTPPHVLPPRKPAVRLSGCASGGTAGRPSSRSRGHRSTPTEDIGPSRPACVRVRARNSSRKGGTVVSDSCLVVLPSSSAADGGGEAEERPPAA